MDKEYKQILQQLNEEFPGIDIDELIKSRYKKSWRERHWGRVLVWLFGEDSWDFPCPPIVTFFMLFLLLIMFVMVYV